MDSATRQVVWQRAKGSCEYCRLPQAAAPFFAFHLEHIRARQHGGDDNLANLALACPDCNRFKGPNLSSIDPETGETVDLFNPRTHSWDEHFAWRGARIVGRTSIGRATVRLLNINEERRMEMRAELQERGEL